MAVSVALDVGGTNIKMALVHQGEILESLSLPVEDNHLLGPLLPVLEQNINQLLSHTQESLAGIGFAFPCIVDSNENKILSDYVKYQDINSLDLGQWAAEKWSTKIQLENDARAALVGEWQYGAGKGYDNLVQVTMGTGIGSAALIDGKLIRGRHYMAGNLGGHMTIDFEGDVCNCGNIGCVEAVASTWSLAEKVQSWEGFQDSLLSRRETIDFQSVFKCVEESDPFAQKVLDHCIRAWSFSMINLVHAFDPECIIVGGGIARSNHILLPKFHEMINKHTWLPEDSVTFKSAEYKDSAALMGLDYLIINQNEI